MLVCKNVEESIVVVGTWPVSLHLSIVDGHKTAVSCSDKEEEIAIFEEILYSIRSSQQEDSNQWMLTEGKLKALDGESVYETFK